MDVQRHTVHPLIRKLATVTCVVSLLPIGMGALVTTLKAGMAFADWPSSDGQNMLLYPWFSDFARDTDKFVEHGHRLAGMLIGVVSLLLAAAGWRLGKGWVRAWVTAILIAVIAQGLLGGARVLLDRQVLAMIHSITGACFFSLCIVFRFLCSNSWGRWTSSADQRFSPAAAGLVAVSTIALMGQYVLGGFLRHLHIMLNEHLAGAAIAAMFSVAAVYFLLRAEHSLLRRAGLCFGAALSLQLLLGFGAYLTRLGLPAIGYVATTGSLSQAIVCSSHTVCGMFLLASSAVSSLSVLLLFRAGVLQGLQITLPAGSLPDRGNAL